MSYGPGWEAIGSAFGRVHGQAENLSFRSLPPEVEVHPCKMVAAWKVGGERAHWHLVTYGLTELFRKVSNLPNQSGWGYELTLRIPGSGEGPPGWAVELLRFLVQTVYSTSHGFGVGHYIPLQGSFGPAAQLSGATFILDPDFQVFDSPHGRLYFLQVVGLTADELTATMRVDDARVVKALAKRDRFLLTDSSRESIFRLPNAPEFPDEPAQGVAGAASLAVPWLRFGRNLLGWSELEVPKHVAEELAGLLHDRIVKHSRSLTVASAELRVEFRPAKEAGFEKQDDLLTFGVTPQLCQEFCDALRGKAEGALELPSLPAVRVRVEWL